MSYSVRISPERYKHINELEICHQWWINFVETELEPHKVGDVIPEDIRADVYRKYHFKKLLGDDVIEFESQSHFTWFILRWS